MNFIVVPKYSELSVKNIWKLVIDIPDYYNICFPDGQNDELQENQYMIDII